MNKIINENIVFNEKFIIEKGEINDGRNTYHRYRINRQDAVAILFFNVESEKIILTRQFRYAIADKSKSSYMK